MCMHAHRHACASIHSHMHERARTHTRARTHAHAHTHTHMLRIVQHVRMLSTCSACPATSISYLASSYFCPAHCGRPAQLQSVPAKHVLSGSCYFYSFCYFCPSLHTVQLQDVPANKEKLVSEDPDVVMEGVTYFREQLSGVCVVCCVSWWVCLCVVCVQ